jgi:translation initiation factor 4A
MSSTLPVSENELNNHEISEDKTYPEIKNWDELEIDANLLRGIYAYGFEKPSPIQEKAIFPLLDGKDLIAQAQSGTGKTAAFSIGALQTIDLSKAKTQVLILSPTRELCVQTAKVVEGIGSMMKGLRVKTVFGGNSYDSHTDHDPHIICGCTGRVYDCIQRNKMDISEIKLVILDEADEMLSSGFKEQVYNIFQNLNNDIQIGLFSATLPSHIYGIINKIMRDPIKITINNDMLTLEGISQFYVALQDDKQKYETIKHLFSFISMSQCIIYCNSIKRVTDLYHAMVEDQFPVTYIHSNMEKKDRDEAFINFKSGKSRVLISSNLTARGIDIQQVSIVINFDIPKCVNTYLHRIGRSGRWGRKGVGINFVCRRDTSKMKEIEEYYSCQIQELPADIQFLQTF